MNGPELLRVVEMIHRDKSIEKNIVFDGIEQAIVSAARKHFGEEVEIDVKVDRLTGEPSASIDGDPLNADEIGDLLGRIAAQTAKQVMIQKIREAERDHLFDEFGELRSQIVTGTVSRVEGGSVTVNLGKAEGFLPRSEQIPGEGYRVGERVRAIVLDVRKAGSRVKIILSRCHADLVRRLFELEIPEIADHVIRIRSISREAGYRTKVAVSCDDSKIDGVGACVGVRGARIKNIINELGGEERIDIVRWNDSLHVLVPNALQPAEVEDVVLCPMLGKVIVLVREDSLSLAIGRKGQNVRLASKLVGWDIHVMTQDRLDEQIDQTIGEFSQAPHVSEELAENLVVQGFFTFDDLSVIEPDQLEEISGLTEEQCAEIVEFADEKALQAEQAEREEYRLKREQAALERLAPSQPAEPSPPSKESAEATEETETTEESTDSLHTTEVAEQVADGEESSPETELTETPQPSDESTEATPPEEMADPAADAEPEVVESAIADASGVGSSDNADQDAEVAEESRPAGGA